MISACAPQSGPRIVPASSFGQSIPVSQFLDNLGEYHAWVAFDPRPTAVFFDPRDDGYVLKIEEPILTVRKVTDPALLHRHIVDLDDRLPYPLEFVKAISISEKDQRVPAGYAYVHWSGDVSLHRQQGSSSEVVVTRVLPLERPRLSKPNFRLGSDD